MRKQDFVKLAGYATGKMTIMFEVNSLLSGRVFMKNDPMECDIHICDDKEAWDLVFFEHDDYEHSKFNIDDIFETITNKYKK